MANSHLCARHTGYLKVGKKVTLFSVCTNYTTHTYTYLESDSPHTLVYCPQDTERSMQVVFP